MHISIIVLIAASIANILLGLIVLARTYRQLYGWFFATTVLSVAVWGVGDVMILTATHPLALEVASRLFYAAPVLIPPSILLFALHFLEKRAITQRQIIFLVVLPLLLATVLAIQPGILLQSVVIHEGGLNTPLIKPLPFALHALYFVSYFTVTYAVMYLKYRRFHGIERRQMLYTLIGVLFASVTALMTNLSLPLMGLVDLVWLGPICTAVFIAAVTISIVRHGLFDIRLIIARSIGYGMSLLALSFIYGFIVFGLIKLFFNIDVALNVQVFIAMTTGLAGLIFQRIQKSFNRLTKRVFYQDAYDSQELLSELNRLLVSTIKLEKLVPGTLQVMSKYIKPDFCVGGIVEPTKSGLRMFNPSQHEFDQDRFKAMGQLVDSSHLTVITADYLEEKHAQLRAAMQQNGIAAMIRLTARRDHPHKETIGFIMLGAKKSGSPYTSQDTTLLESISNELTVAVQNALHFEEIQNFNVTLQEKVNDATKKLRNNNQRLKSLDETKDDFISMASHQLRTPLTSVKGYLSMVLDGDAGDINQVQKQMLTQAYTSSQRMVYLISDLLNVSRLKTGKFIITPSKVNLADMVEEEVAQLVDTAASRNIKIIYDKPDRWPMTYLDDTKVRQVVMNFMDNAIYYTRPGGEVNIKLAETADAVELKIKDDGIGVPKSEQRHLFTKFYRANNARQIRPDGTGLGLFMAKKVVVAQGGSLLFKSAEGKGSTFGFSFAKQTVAVPADEAAPAPGPITIN